MLPLYIFLLHFIIDYAITALLLLTISLTAAAMPCAS